MPAFRATVFFSLDQLFQRLGQVRILENLARLRRLAVRKIDLRGRGIFQDLLRFGYIRGTKLTQREAVIGEVDRRLQHLLKRHRSPAVEKDVPGIDDPGESSRKKAVTFGDLASVVLLVPLDRRQLWRTGFSVDGIDLLVAGIVDKQDSIAAETVQ